MFLFQLLEMVILLSFEDLSLEDVQMGVFKMSHKDVHISALGDGNITIF